MTVLEFQQKYCSLCGTQSCFGEAEDISHCGRYHGEIDGVPKIKSLWEEWNEYMDVNGITWEDIRKSMPDHIKFRKQ